MGWVSRGWLGPAVRRVLRRQQCGNVGGCSAPNSMAGNQVCSAFTQGSKNGTLRLAGELPPEMGIVWLPSAAGKDRLGLDELVSAAGLHFRYRPCF